jgi:hypothetical protein
MRPFRFPKPQDSARDGGHRAQGAQIDYLDIPARVGERLDRNDRPLVEQH